MVLSANYNTQRLYLFIDSFIQFESGNVVHYDTQSDKAQKHANQTQKHKDKRNCKFNSFLTKSTSCRTGVLCFRGAEMR